MRPRPLFFIVRHFCGCGPIEQTDNWAGDQACLRDEKKDANDAGFPVNVEIAVMDLISPFLVVLITNDRSRESMYGGSCRYLYLSRTRPSTRDRDIGTPAPVR